MAEVLSIIKQTTQKNPCYEQAKQKQDVSLAAVERYIFMQNYRKQRDAGICSPNIKQRGTE